MALSDSKKSVSLSRAEHVSVDDGESINAKRVAVYETQDGVEWIRGGTQFSTNIDDTSTTNVSYIGKAPIGSATSSAVWQIKKLDTSSGLITTWADGNASFDNVWDDRVSLTYN